MGVEAETEVGAVEMEEEDVKLIKSTPLFNEVHTIRNDINSQELECGKFVTRISLIDAAMSSGPSRKAPRRRKLERGIGEPTEDDNRSSFNLHHKETESLASRRYLPPPNAPSLSSLAAKAFASNIRGLAGDGVHGSSWKHTKRMLELLPDHLVHLIFSMLQTSVPTLLNNAFITAVSDFSR